jgi:hypothetical protein
MESNSNEFISKIIYNSIGVFDKFLYFPNPFMQKKLKDIDFSNDIIFLKVFDNKLYLYVFADFTYEYADDVMFDYNDDLIAISLANWIYNNNYYRSNFKSLSYSLDYNLTKNNYISMDMKINVYSKNYLPDEYYKLTKNEIHYNIKVISHLMYKNELEGYLRNFEMKNI